MAENLTRYRISGMDCAACAVKIENAVRRIPGISDVSVSATAGTLTLRHADALPAAAIESRVRRLGYGIEPGAGTAKPAPRSGSPGHGPDHAAHDHGHDHHDHPHAAPHDHGHGHEPGHEHASGGAHGHAHAHPVGDGPWWRNRRVVLTLLCGAALAAAYGIGLVVPAWQMPAFLVALLIGLVPIARRAVVAGLNGTPFSIETLMTIAAVGAVLIDATEEAAAVVLLFLVGELLEGIAADRARASIKALAALVPKTALLEEASGTREVPAANLAVGAVILVRPGDRIAADGEIVEGTGAIDEAPVTGESVPVRKGPGAAVFAGTIATDAVLRVRVTAAAEDNTIARVVRLVEEAQEAKAPTERLIDRFATAYTPAVLALGALVAIVPPLAFGADWGAWIYKGLAVLLIGCPCALVISTPAAIAAALSAGARRGLLIKGGAVLEGLGTIDVMALDKTGTLTEGRPVVTDLIAIGLSERETLSLAAALENGSSHPLALAILAAAEARKAPVPPAADAAAIAGKGVVGRVGGKSVFVGSAGAAAERAPLSEEDSARIAALHDGGKSVSLVVADGRLAGIIAMRDEPRADAKAGLAALKRAGIETLMLTGDNRRTAAAIAGDLGLEYRAEMLPQDKQAVVKELQQAGRRVAKVGDGINDAPALAAADIGIAMGGGTDVALETADATVLHGRLTDLAAMIALSRRTLANVRQNITIALGLKAVFLVTTLVGVTGLWPAILADTGATVLVTANALRLLRFDPTRARAPRPAP
ncbi:heavy metal translocating P-type ATPase [Prosthecomicrobium pneumaticum]|uniref:P-type Zn(2+) transporter n=1 Tax=Prosthecomicrobium pneumaticum TaxID=81895 RepID=A0A7W9CSE7_9HYPH|nr:heavy metal translocating P-type ATPase [Prosthecomicrobium pneumaticum]MBB5751065.1 Cd2+/Zn2+-exporting ATPase [Prosthecomicrobium pneumaticum]